MNNVGDICPACEASQLEREGQFLECYNMLCGYSEKENAAMRILDHVTHYHDQDETDTEYPDNEEFGRYKSERDAADEIGCLVRKSMVEMEGTLYADRMFFDYDRLFGKDNQSHHGGNRGIYSGSTIHNFQQDVECTMIARALQLALIGQVPEPFELRWYDTEVVEDITGVMSWVSQQTRDNAGTAAVKGYTDVENWIHQCWAYYVTPLLPDGEDSDEGMSGSIPIVMNQFQWAIVDEREELGENNLPWTQTTFNGEGN